MRRRARLTRREAFWIAILVGGWLQAKYTETRHPSLALKIWEVFFASLWVYIVVRVIFALTSQLRRWLSRGG